MSRNKSQINRTQTRFETLQRAAMDSVDSIIAVKLMEADMDAGRAPVQVKLAAQRAYLLDPQTRMDAINAAKIVAMEMKASPDEAKAVIEMAAVQPGQYWRLIKESLPSELFPLPAFRMISDLPSYMSTKPL